VKHVKNITKAPLKATQAETGLEPLLTYLNFFVTLLGSLATALTGIATSAVTVLGTLNTALTALNTDKQDL
jgi:hypothetical protein